MIALAMLSLGGCAPHYPAVPPHVKQPDMTPGNSRRPRNGV